MENQNQILSPPTPWTPFESQPLDPLRKSKLHDEIQSSLLKLSTSKFYEQFLTQLRSSRIESLLDNIGTEFELVVYGIGSIESDKDARLQLALALLLRRELDTRIFSIQLFDPILSLVECTVLEELEFTVMRVDEHGQREVKIATLFFMPHCGANLYENLLSANWNPEGLRKIVILGNSFRGYLRNTKQFFTQYSMRFKDIFPKVMMASKFDTEIDLEVVQKEKVEEWDDFSDVFCRTSWHFFELKDDRNLNEHKLELAAVGNDEKETMGVP